MTTYYKIASYLNFLHPSSTYNKIGLKVMIHKSKISERGRSGRILHLEVSHIFVGHKKVIDPLRNQAS